MSWRETWAKRPRNTGVWPDSQFAAAQRVVTGTEVALAGGGDLVAARRWADDAVSVLVGSHLAQALTARARVAIAQDERDEAEHDAHDAFACAASIGAYVTVPDVLELLAVLATTSAVTTKPPGSSARLRPSASVSARSASRCHQANYEASVAALRDAMGEADFDTAWAEGAALSTEEAIAYAQRGRGERKRPSSGWASLTPAELDVVRLACKDLGNKDIATRLFVSPRTVQAHLTHVYTKLGVTSRVQLAQEAARHADLAQDQRR